jgi:hypothetical protein
LAIQAGCKNIPLNPSAITGSFQRAFVKGRELRRTFNRELEATAYDFGRMQARAASFSHLDHKFETAKHTQYRNGHLGAGSGKA